MANRSKAADGPTSNRPVWSRGLDLLYLVFFCIHIPVMFSVDCAPLYPEWMKPAFAQKIQNFYVTSYKDKFFIDPPAWFRVYVLLEIVYHVPLSLWAIYGLFTDHRSVPLQLLIWSVQTSVTTLTCLVEVWDWTHINRQEKVTLSQLYAPYLALAVGMGIDMFFRLKRQLDTAGKAPRMEAAAVRTENSKNK